MVQSYVSLGKSDLWSVLACMTVHHPCAHVTAIWAYGIQLTRVINFNILQSPDCNLQEPVFDRELWKLDLLYDHMIHLTAYDLFNNCSKMFIKLSLVIWWLALWLCWLTTKKIRSQLQLLSRGLPVSNSDKKNANTVYTFFTCLNCSPM